MSGCVVPVITPTPVITSEGTWAGVTDQNLLYALATDGTYLYVGGSMAYETQPVWMAKVRIATLETVATWTGEATQYNALNALYLDGYVYMCLQNGNINEPSQVVKIRASDMTLVGTWTDPDGVTNLAGITTDGTYLYVGREQQTAKVRKLNPSDMSLVATWTDTGPNRAFTLVYDGTYLYVGEDTNPAKVIKINTTTMTTVSVWTGSTGDGYCEGVVFDGTYIYAGLYRISDYSLPMRIVKIDRTTMTTVAVWNGADGQASGIEGFSYYDGMLWAPISVPATGPDLILGVDPASMTTVSTWSAPMGQTGLMSCCFDGTFLYIGFFNWGSPPTQPGQVIKLALSVSVQERDTY